MRTSSSPSSSSDEAPVIVVNFEFAFIQNFPIVVGQDELIGILTEELALVGFWVLPILPVHGCVRNVLVFYNMLSRNSACCCYNISAQVKKELKLETHYQYSRAQAYNILHHKNTKMRRSNRMGSIARIRTTANVPWLPPPCCKKGLTEKLNSGIGGRQTDNTLVLECPDDTASLSAAVTSSASSHSGASGIPTLSRTATRGGVVSAKTKS